MGESVQDRFADLVVWETKQLRATNCPEAEQFIQHHYRKGWSL